MFLLVDLVGSYKVSPEMKKRAQELRLKLEQEAVKKVRVTLPPVTQCPFCTPQLLQQAETCSTGLARLQMASIQQEQEDCVCVAAHTAAKCTV